MVCQKFLYMNFIKFYFSEPEISTTQNENDDSVTNQDGWLNALSLEKLTTTVCETKTKV